MTFENKNIESLVVETCKLARKAEKSLALATTEQKNQALSNIKKHLENSSDRILRANLKDVELAQQSRSGAYIDRLQLNESRLQAMVANLETVIELPDPIGKELARWTVPSGLTIIKRCVPLGVLGIIYESRPNVTCDASVLCIKSGNAAILRTGSDSLNTALELIQCIHQGLEEAGLPKEACSLISVKDREAVDILVQQDEYVDVIIPRGGPGLISSIASKSKVPLFKHLAGVCHTYIHKDADPEIAVNVTFNAKMRRTGICGATETILVDREVAHVLLPPLLKKLQQAGCEIRGDEVIRALDPAIVPAKEEDWSTEYLDAIVSIKAVDGLDEAIAHIEKYGTHHTEAIITRNKDAANQFHKGITSAITLENASTQFADGGEFGMGMEIGISTGRLHARGPVGVEQLTTYKYEIIGSGQMRS